MSARQYWGEDTPDPSQDIERKGTLDEVIDEIWWAGYQLEPFREAIQALINQARVDELKRLKNIDAFNEHYSTDPRPSRIVSIRIAELTKEDKA
jgi:hypothetical protein